MPYGRFVTRALFSHNTDLSMPEADSHFDTLDVTSSIFLQQRIAVPTTSLLVDLGGMTTVHGFLIVNHSTTAAEEVKVRWMGKAGRARAGTELSGFAFTAGAPNKIFNNDVASFSPYGATAGGLVVISGSEGGGANDGTYLIDAVAATAVDGDTLEISSTTLIPLTNNPDTAATATFYSYCRQHVAANKGKLLVTGSILASYDLELTSLSGSPTVEVFVLGS